MEDKIYLRLRKVFFWLFFTAFLILAPTLIFYSLGYKFNMGLNKFQKTGAISIKCYPNEVVAYLDDKKLSDITPCTIRELLPKAYTLRLEKDNFYSYVIPIEVKSSSVSKIDVMLMPEIRNVEKLPTDLNIYKFFILERLFGKAIIIFSEKGLYLLTEDFKNIKKIADLDIDSSVIGNILGVKEGKNQFVFWNKNNIWLVRIPQFQDNGNEVITNIYSAKEIISNVFFCLKERYLIVHDGMKIIALDIRNPGIFFTIIEVKSMTAEILYDSDDDILYTKDKLLLENKSSLFKINLMELLHERKAQ